MKRPNWTILIIIGIVAGIIISLLVARQKAQARYVEKSREADSLCFVAMVLQKQVEAMVGLGEYGQDTLWLPAEIDSIPYALPPDAVLVPKIVGTVSFDTTRNFEFAEWSFGVRVKGKFYCGREYKHLNRLYLYPTYWTRPPLPKPDILAIDPQLIRRIGFGVVVVNDYAGLSGRFDRFTVMAMKRLGHGWAAGANYEFLRF